MDALISNDEGKIGAVCGIQNVKNPITVARLVLEKTENVILIGAGANRFAIQMGIECCSPEDLLTSNELERYNKTLPGYKPKTSFKKEDNPMGTVGCVCIDIKRKMAVGLSTGGVPFKRPGRIGDTPLWGAGGYIDSEFGGAAATGYGEDIIRTLLTRQVVDYMKYEHLSAQDATEKAIKFLKEKGGLGGLIVLSKEGGLGIYFNTPRMAFGFNTSGNKNDYFVGIEKVDLPIFNK